MVRFLFISITFFNSIFSHTNEEYFSKYGIPITEGENERFCGCYIEDYILDGISGKLVKCSGCKMETNSGYYAYGANPEHKFCPDNLPHVRLRYFKSESTRPSAILCCKEDLSYCDEITYGEGWRFY